MIELKLILIFINNNKSLFTIRKMRIINGFVTLITKYSFSTRSVKDFSVIKLRVEL